MMISFLYVSNVYNDVKVAFKTNIEIKSTTDVFPDLDIYAINDLYLVGKVTLLMNKS